MGGKYADCYNYRSGRKYIVPTPTAAPQPTTVHSPTPTPQTTPTITPVIVPTDMPQTIIYDEDYDPDAGYDDFKSYDEE